MAGHLLAVRNFGQASCCYCKPSHPQLCRTAPHLQNQVKCIALLMEKDADVDAEDSKGRSPLHLAAASGSVECVTLLLSKSDEDAEDEAGNTPAWLALAEGHIQVAEALFDAGADISMQCEDGKTYLHQAAAMGSAEAASMLIGRGAPVSALDRDRCTPLMLACQSGAWEVGRKLLEAKADASAIGKDSWTAMHFAAQNISAADGALDFVELLCKKGASPSARTRDGLPVRGVVGMNVGKRSRAAKDADEEMRDMLEELANN